MATQHRQKRNKMPNLKSFSELRLFAAPEIVLVLEMALAKRLLEMPELD